MIRLSTVFAFALLGGGFGCDEQFILQNEDPIISEAQMVVLGCGDEQEIYLDLLIGDPEGDEVDISIQTGDPTNPVHIYPGPLGVGLRGLTTTPAGVWHRIQWTACSTDPGPCPIAHRMLDGTMEDNCRCSDPPTTNSEAFALSIEVSHEGGATTTYGDGSANFMLEQPDDCL